MDNKHEFIQYFTEKGKKRVYIDECESLLDSLYTAIKNEPPSPEAIGAFIRGRWSGYVSRDRATYRILKDYADFCEITRPLFTEAFKGHIRETFEGEARKAMRAYKDALVYIPDDTRIDPCFLEGLTNDEFTDTFRTLQKLVYDIYDGIERGSPFDWGWPDWKAITAEGLNYNRVMMILDALVGSGQIESGRLVVDKKRFYGYSICKPMASINLMLKKFMEMGFLIEELDNKQSSVFYVSYPSTPNLIPVLCSYFKNRPGENKNHIRVFSYRFVEYPAAQSHETLFLAITDGEPAERREIYYWLYNEAVKHGFTPTGKENMGCYVYKNGSKEWLVLGSGSSYHEDEFLHSVKYKLAAKARFYRVFQTNSNEIDALMKRFPDSFGRWWTQCFKCGTGADDCKYHIRFTTGSRSYCAKHHHLYFHDPDFNDVKKICELYKLENSISVHLYLAAVSLNSFQPV